MRKGFTLVEVMIVVAIIALLAAIAIPNLLRARHNANESAAQGTLKTIAAAEMGYRGVTPNFGSLAQLIAADPPYIDETIDDAAGRQGYVFSACDNITSNQFCFQGIPATYGQSGTRSFCVTEDGVIRGDDQGAAAGPADHDDCQDNWNVTGN